MARAPKKQPTFLTKRLRLRPFRGSDLKALHALYGDADNLRYWSVEASPNLERTRKMLRWHVAYGRNITHCGRSSGAAARAPSA